MPATNSVTPFTVDDWRAATTRTVDTNQSRHSIHSYFITCPESPDTQLVAFYTSTAANGEQGELRIVRRLSGEEVAVIPIAATEDAHRVACQQWAGGGDFLVYHEWEDDDWRVKRFELATGKVTVLAEDRLVGFGQPGCDWQPVYGKHWAPGDCRDLQVINVRTGELRTELTMAELRETYPEAVATLYGDQPTSIFFPCLSPDGNRLFVKLAAPAGGPIQSPKASHRQGLFGFDRRERRLLFGHDDWGHPCWMPDSRTLLQVHTKLIDSDTGAVTPIPGMPRFSGSHPSPSPDGRLFTTDSQMHNFGGTRQDWSIVVGAVAGEAWAFIDTFSMTGGANSWRVPHPHPVFSADGRRLYYNRNDGPWTHLHVASMDGSN